MKTSLFLGSVLTATLLFTGCATSQTSLDNASPKVKMLIEKNNLEVVGFDYVKEKIAKGSRKSAKAILIDARPEAKFKKGAIPSSINIPDTKFEEYYSQLKDVKKDKELIVYCGGWKCGKSPKLAAMLKKKGFTNIKLYQAGEPQWAKKSYLDVDLVVAIAAQAKNSALLIDARPYAKYLQETIPGAISIPDTKLKTLEGRFPVNKDEKIITFCGGYVCAKSHIVANRLLDLGYSDVSVFAGGMPAWKKAGLATTKSASLAKKDDTKSKVQYSKNGLKKGLDEGSVDGEWFYDLIKNNKVPSYIQIVDVTAPDEFKKGHLKGAINIEAEKLNAKEFYSKLPKNKTIVFNCTAGGRSMDAWVKLKDAKIDMGEIYYFDANIDCKGDNCKIEVNEPLGV